MTSTSVASGANFGERQIRSLLFADVTNYSWIRDQHLPGFQAAFLRIVRELIDALSDTDILYSNTWGDGLFMVFSSPACAAGFGVNLVARMEEIDWAAQELPKNTTVRVALHAGPVFEANDPIIKRTSFFGSHVNLAARVEAITPPGCVLATEAFFVRLLLDPGRQFDGDYAGLMELPKRRGRVALYQINPV